MYGRFDNIVIRNFCKKNSNINNSAIKMMFKKILADYELMSIIHKELQLKDTNNPKENSANCHRQLAKTQRG